MFKKLLIIPDLPPAINIKRSEWEIAKCMTEFCKVYYLSWEVADKQAFFSRAEVALKSLFPPKISKTQDGVTVVQLPMLRRPLGVARLFNQWQLKRFLIESQIDIVLNASTYFYSVPDLRNLIYWYDFRDIPSSRPDSHYGKLIYQHTEQEVKKADIISAVSYNLIDFIKERYHRDAHYFPNGATFADFERVGQFEINQNKAQYGFRGKFIIGYISHFGPWSNLSFAIDVFKALKREMSDAALFIVGPGEEVDRLKDKTDSEDIVFTGAIKPKEIHRYFCTLDVGILTSPLSGFRDMSFPIKIIEYGAARKMAVSTPLSELKRVKFPNVIFASPGNIDEWKAALKQARNTEWQDEWDDQLKQYDWKTICRDFYNVIEQIKS